MIDVEAFFRAVIEKDAKRLAPFFAPGAEVIWRQTGERFTAEEYVRVNCGYPGEWRGEIERIHVFGPLAVVAAAVRSADSLSRHHVVSFIECDGEFITKLDEYWSEDADAPERSARGNDEYKL